MATSAYFNNYNNRSEQSLIEDLITESIKIMGVDCYYLPNENDAARDLLFGEDPVKKFTSAFPIELYLSSALDYQGEREFFSKFGLEIKNNVSVIVSKRSFAKRVPQNILVRPREGDLIYVPFLNGYGEIFEIKFADQNKDFFTLGRKVPYFYELQLEKFRFSQEVIDVGIKDIDDINMNAAYNIIMKMIDGTGPYTIGEVVYQSPTGNIADATCRATLRVWDSNQNVMEVTNIAGEFQIGQYVYGQLSGKKYTLYSFDPLQDNVPNETYDNGIIHDEGVTVINTDETNAFGKL